MEHNTNIIEASGRPVRAGRANDRRGVAMLLALCAVATATIVTASYVASRENTPSIAGNALDATSAKWAAESAGDLAVAALETGLDLADLSDPSTLLSSIQIAGGTASVAITDTEGNDPAPDASQVVVTISATVGGVTSTSQRIIQLQPPVPFGECIDPELGEFGIFAASELTMESGSIFAPWPSSPGVVVGGTINMGVGFSSDSSLSIHPSSILAVTKLFTDVDAVSSLKGQVASAQFSGGAALPVQVPAIRAGLPTSAQGLTVRTVLNMTVLSTRGLATGLYQDVTVDNAAVVTLSAGAYSFNDLRLEDNAVLRINGDVVVHVRDDFEVLRGSAIEFVDASSKVSFFVADGFELSDAAIGVDRAIARNASRSGGSVTGYINPARLKIYSLNESSGGAGSSNYAMATNSILVGVLIAPASAVTVGSGCTLFGRVTGAQVAVKTGGAILYDPTLNKGQGLTVIDGPLYTDDGQPVAGLEDVLNEIATGTTDLLSVTTGLLAGVLGGGSGGDSGGELGGSPPGDVTPRTADTAVAKSWPTLARSLEQSVESESPSNGLLVDVDVGEVCGVGGDAQALEIE